jgi:UDPglucose 6-dehydrogenase
MLFIFHATLDPKKNLIQLLSVKSAKETTIFGKELKMKKIVVIGCGYVGLVTAACLAEVGHIVTCLDVDEAKIAALKNGKIPIYEPGLDEMVIKNIHLSRLHFTTSYQEAISDAPLVMIAVDTPPRKDGSCDTRNLERAAQMVGQKMTNDLGIVIKSTVPVGTSYAVTSIISSTLEKRGVNFWFEVISNPEFLREGLAIVDFMKPDRVIIGLRSERAEELMRTLYQPFGHPEKLIFMDVASSELTKYAANSMLALRISFMNSLTLLCEQTGADIEAIKKGIGSDKRIGSSFLNAGLGYGGSCFPKDVKALEQMLLERALPSDIITAIDSTNERQKHALSDKIFSFFGGSLERKTIAILGLAFKPDTDDMREAPSLVLINDLLEQGATLRVYDPVAMENTKKILPPSSQLIFCENEESAISGADAIALVTEWSRFRNLDYKSLLRTMKGNAFFDGRNQFSPERMAALGFSYISIGRKPVVEEIEAAKKVVFQS